MDRSAWRSGLQPRAASAHCSASPTHVRSEAHEESLALLVASAEEEGLTPEIEADLTKYSEGAVEIGTAGRRPTRSAADSAGRAGCALSSAVFWVPYPRRGRRPSPNAARRPALLRGGHLPCDCGPRASICVAAVLAERPHAMLSAADFAAAERDAPPRVSEPAIWLRPVATSRRGAPRGVRRFPPRSSPPPSATRHARHTLASYAANRTGTWECCLAWCR